jgi:sirohydrochlorin ferrochelatase
MSRAIILIDHGSQRAEANAMLEQVGRMLGEMTRDRVYVSHMELASPSLSEAFDAAVADGADRVFVFPYFLSPGRHSQEDIPRMCREAAAGHPDVAWHCDEPFGLDAGLCEIILGRVADVDG